MPHTDLTQAKRPPIQSIRGTAALIIGLGLVLGCAGGDGSPGGGGGGTKGFSGPRETVTVTIDYGSEKKTWMEEMIQAYEAAEPTLPSGERIDIVGNALGSGDAMEGILDGSRKPEVFSPASSAYLSLLEQRWAGKSPPTQGTADALVLSPVVIAMWKPMAEALGWPGKPVGWAELLRIHQSPQGWAGLGHPEWGAFKLGHTHPGMSNSGLLAVLAEAYAGSGKARGLTEADLDAPATQRFLADVEGSIVYYGKSTGFFSDKMLERGPAFLSAAVLYENLVVESYGKQTGAPFPLVSIYPTEGTFWSDHPYAIMNSDYVTPKEKEAATAFLTFLKSPSAQQRAMALGFRPSDPNIAIGAPLDAAHGVDPLQPQTLLEVPNGATLQHLLGVWQQVKRPSSVVLVFDKSGSMRGQPLTDAKAGAKAFMGTLSERDELSILFFDSKVPDATAFHTLDAAGRAELGTAIDNVFADGGTAFYDAVLKAFGTANERRAKDPKRIYAVVAMTDGKDENSALQLSSLVSQFNAESDNPVKVFTIAYGPAPDGSVLEQIANAAQGGTAKGTATEIQTVFRDIAAFF